MADTDRLEPRLEFLKRAGHALAIQSPTIAATLGAERDRLMVAHDADLDAPKKTWSALRRDICGACGNTMLPGWSCVVATESNVKVVKKSKRRPRRKEKNIAEKTMVYTCSRCNHNTLTPLQTRPAKHLKKAAQTSRFESAAPSSREDDKSNSSKTVNASSKQRAKARKGGLQAMLAKSKTQTSGQSGFGLDLMDFLQ